MNSYKRPLHKIKVLYVCFPPSFPITFMEICKLHLHPGQISGPKSNISGSCLSLQYGKHARFLWRLARAYGDMFEMTTDVEEKKKYVANGRWNRKTRFKKMNFDDGRKAFTVSGIFPEVF